MLANVSAEAQLHFLQYLCCFSVLCNQTMAFESEVQQVQAQTAGKEFCPWCPSEGGAVSLPTRTGWEEKGTKGIV